MEALNFDLDRAERAVTIGGQAYVLIELDGKQRDKYLTALSNRMKTTKEGKPAGFKTFDGMQADLVVECLRKVDETTGDRTPVSMETIQSWPAKVSTGLFEAAQELSGLNESEDSEEEPGND